MKYLSLASSNLRPLLRKLFFHFHHYRSVHDDVVVGDDDGDDDGDVEGRDKRALPVRCDPFHQARPGKVAHHYLHIGPTLQFLHMPTLQFLHIARPSI